MSNNPNMASVSGYPVSAQNFLQPGGPTTADLRNQANPQRPNWGERSSSSNREEIASLGSDAPLTGPPGGIPPSGGHVGNFGGDSWDNDNLSLHGRDVDHQTHQAFSLYPSNMPGRAAGPVPMSPWVEDPVQISPDGNGGAHGNMQGAAWGHRGMSRKKKWIIAGVVVGASLAALAIGLGVYFGAVRKSPPPPPPVTFTVSPTSITSNILTPTKTSTITVTPTQTSTTSRVTAGFFSSGIITPTQATATSQPRTGLISSGIIGAIQTTPVAG